MLLKDHGRKDLPDDNGAHQGNRLVGCGRNETFVELERVED